LAASFNAQATSSEQPSTLAPRALLALQLISGLASDVVNTLLMEEIRLQHLKCIKPCIYLNNGKYYLSTDAVNRIQGTKRQNVFFPMNSLLRKSSKPLLHL